MLIERLEAYTLVGEFGFSVVTMLGMVKIFQTSLTVKVNELIRYRIVQVLDRCEIALTLGCGWFAGCVRCMLGDVSLHMIHVGKWGSEFAGMRVGIR